MVCIYCGEETRVVNSRLQKRINCVWRRRRCSSCDAVFTSIESNAYESSLMVKHGTSHIVPFERDLLFVSVYDACRHRAHAISDASAITSTILGKLQQNKETQGIIERDYLISVTSSILRRFDTAAYVYYQAYHPPSIKG